MRLWDGLLDLFFPPKCVFCGALLERGGPGICGGCRDRLPYTRGGSGQKTEFVSEVLSPLYYEKEVRDSLRRFKFGGADCYAETYARLMAEPVERLDGRYDVLSWVPLSRRRLRRRGYDQARLLAEALGRRLGREAVPALKKIRNAPPQSRAGGKAARRANITGCYEAPEPERTAGRRILLVDDIITTGATLSECARVLRLAGAADVFAVTVARSRDRQET